MSRKTTFVNLTLLSFLLGSIGVRAQTQSDDMPKFEVGAELTSITKSDFIGRTTEPGIGGRFTYNLRKSIALEGVGYFFPRKHQGGVLSDTNGNIAEGLFGVKAGKRLRTWGAFVKARPGFLSFSQGNSGYVATGTGGVFPFTLSHTRDTHFAFDVGAVIEFYPSKHIVTRFDAGDTFVHFGRHTSNFLSLAPITGAFVLQPLTRKAVTRQSFQIAASVGFRF